MAGKLNKVKSIRPRSPMPYDHTIERTFNLPSLTRRDAAAPDLGVILTEPARNDSSPLPLQPPKAFAMAKTAKQKSIAAKPLNDLQRSMVEAMKNVVAEKTSR